jgi:anti-sigma regulatory factor (Ser/Thr protein kinase)
VPLLSWRVRDLPPVPACVGDVRRRARAVLTEWDAAAVEPEVLLLLTELTANVVRHAGTPFDVTLTWDGHRVRCEVADGDPTAPRLRSPAPDDPGGRGLHLVDELADRWGVREAGSGKTVWFELAVPPPTG